MATSNSDIERKISNLRAEILSYKPGKAKPCDDERVVFPEKLVIGVIQPMSVVSPFLLGVTKSDIVCNLRRVLHGDVEKRSSTETQEEYLTDSISVINETLFIDLDDEALSRLWTKVECEVLGLELDLQNRWSRWIQQVKKITGLLPICAVGIEDGTGKVSQEHRNMLKKQGITDIYGVPIIPMYRRSLSDQERFELLSLLHRCLVEGDVKLGVDVNNVYKNVSSQQIYETERKRVTEARQEIRMRSEENKILQQKYDDLETKLHDVSSSHDSLLNDNASLKDELKGVREKEDQTEKELNETANRARQMEKSLIKENMSLKNELKDVQEQKEQTEKEMTETANRARHMEKKYKQSKINYEVGLADNSKKEEEMKLLKQENSELETKLRDVSSINDSLLNDNVSLKDELTDVQERKRQTQEEIADIKSKGKRMEDMYKKNEVKYENELRSTKLHLDALMETVKKTEETAKHEIEELKNERQEYKARFEEKNQSMELMKEKIGSKELNIEQLEREIWKLRTKIQLESEMRSEEQKKKAKKPQWLESFIPWIASGKQAQTGTSETNESSEDKSSTSDRDDLPSREDPASDAFADILKQIADDLYDDSKIDSLGGQLGILQGDIQRALKSNMRFQQITSDGTRHMLQQWRRGVSREGERGELRRALLAAKLVDLADRYVPEKTEASTEEVQSKDVKDDLSIGRKDDIPVAQGDLSSGTNEDTAIEHTSLHIHTFSETSEDETTVDQAPLHIDPSTNTNEDTTSTTDQAHLQVDPSINTNEDTTSTTDQAPLHIDPSSETYKDTSTIDPAPLQVDPTAETNEEMAHGSMNTQEPGDLSKPITTEVHHESKDEGCPTSVVGGDITTGYQDLICHLASNETSSDKLLIIFFVKVLLNIPHRAFGL